MTWTVVAVITSAGSHARSMSVARRQCPSMGHKRTVMEIVVAVVAAIDIEYPGVPAPGDWAVEVAAVQEQAVLCGSENPHEAAVADAPACSVEVGTGIESHQVVEVDLVDRFILSVVESQFVGHFVGEEECLVVCLVVCHRIDRDGYRHQHGHHHDLFHRRIYLVVIHLVFFSLMQR